MNYRLGSCRRKSGGAGVDRNEAKRSEDYGGRDAPQGTRSVLMGTGNTAIPPEKALPEVGVPE
jgi:hypothetical protein